MFTKEMLIELFVSCNWDECKIYMDCGDVVWITPCPAYGKDRHNVSSIDDIDFFLMDSTGINLYGCEDINDVVKTLNEYEVRKSEDANEKIKLSEFFESCIKGHTTKEYEYGIQIYKVLESKDNYSWDKRYEFLDTLVSEIDINKKRAHDALNLVDNCGTYSDWYKDVYGHRPRYSLS